MSISDGDIVILKSGGPKMTANSSGYPGNYTCTWFEDEVYMMNNGDIVKVQKKRESMFHENILIKCPE